MIREINHYFKKRRMMLIMNAEKQILETYRDTANAIVNRHVHLLSSLPKKEEGGSTKEFLKAFSQHLKVINAELAANAEKVLNETCSEKIRDRKKLNEHLFIIRKDCFNEFLRQSELCL